MTTPYSHMTNGPAFAIQGSRGLGCHLCLSHGLVTVTVSSIGLAHAE
jgi:hypothetical protein